MIFARKMPEFYIIIARKNIFTPPCPPSQSVSVAQLVNATVHATGTGGQTTLRFSSGDVWFAY